MVASFAMERTGARQGRRNMRKVGLRNRAVAVNNRVSACLAVPRLRQEPCDCIPQFRMTPPPIEEMSPRDHHAPGSPTVLRAITSPVEMEGRWFVTEVVPQRERRVALTLGRVDGLNCYLPLERVANTYGNRAFRQWDRVMMPGYLFTCCRDGEAEYALRRARDNIRGIIEIRDQSRFVRELQSFHAANVAGGVTLYRGPVVGQPCLITKGEMAGSRGILISTANRWRFILRITVMGQAWEKEVAPEYLQIIGDADEAAA